jgi:glycosyltransferase involved in cell wall biosynthesis
MADIVVLSPLPPVRSDAAMAGAALVSVLRKRRGHLVRASWPIPESIEALVADSDLPVYHLSNDPGDREIYEMALEWPGLVVLHDLVLDHLVRGLLKSREPAGIETAREVVAASDRPGVPAFPEPLATPWCALVARRARGLVVHSSFEARYLEALGVRTPIMLAPPPALADPPRKGAARRGRRLRRRLGAGAVLGVVGELGPEMGLALAVEASRGLDVPASIVAVGHRRAEEDGSAIAFHGEPVIWAGDLPEEEMMAWLAACDVVMDLRHPPRPSVTTAVIRALQMGVPVVASSPMALPDGTEDSATVLTASPPDPPEVARAVARMLGDPRSSGMPGKAAAERVAAGVEPAYRAAIDTIVSLLRDPIRWSLGRWAEALVDVGVPEGSVARGYGVAYTQALEELRPR